ncbi:MAG: hypothetical protein Q9203_000923 [Teloschistes exilis]
MSFRTPRIDFLKNLSNFLPLGTLVLPSGPLENFTDQWEESYPNLVRSNNPAVYEETRRPIWTLGSRGILRTFVRRHPLDHSQTQVRIYILPADVGRTYVERDARDWESVRKLMEHVDVSKEAWEGAKDLGLPYHNCLSFDYDSLFYLFNTLPSPDPSASGMTCSFSQHAVNTLLDESEIIQGLRTSLYAYQRRSAAMIIRREAEPIRAVDPRLEEIECPAGGKSFYDSLTGVFYRHPRYYEEPKGGILAETMGLNSSILTADDGSLTSLRSGQDSDLSRSNPRVSRTLASDTSSILTGATAKPTSGGSWNTTYHRIPSPPQKQGVAGANRRSSRGSCHWRSEIFTHIEGDALKTLYLDSNEILTPAADDLLVFDVILMTKRRLEEEMALDSPLKNACKCTNTERCRCAKDPYHSPLEDLHFLRIIVDEGHDFSSFGRKNNAVFALQKLHVERRWIISGTPSSGLLGIDASTAILETLGGDSDGDSRLVRHTLERRRSSGLELDLEPSVRKAALLQERKDLEKLGSIVIDFLNLKPWSNTKLGDDAASWKQYIIPNDNGQRKPRSLASVLESLVVRHRIEDVEKDIKLPPLYNQTIYLEPRYHDKLSLNLFIMTLAVNAVTSERVDQDYMFHPKNRGPLNQLITNLRYAGFYWTGFTRDELLKSIDVSRRYLEAKWSIGQNEGECGSLRPGDFDFLQRAIEIGETVLASPSWMAFSVAHELGMYIDDFPSDARNVWSLIKGSEFDSTNEPMPLLITGAPQMAKAQQHVDVHLYEPDPSSGLGSLGKRTLDKLWQDVQPTPAKKRRLGNDHSSPEQNFPTDERALVSTSIQKPTTLGKRTMSQGKQSVSPRKAVGRRPSDSKPQALSEEVAGKETFETAILASALKNSSITNPISPIDSTSPLYHTRLTGTASAKLSYLIDRISTLHRSEKILIFYEGDNIAFYIAQTLELLGIQFLIYTGSLSAARKAAYINSFTTTETFRVLLMDAHQAAHGLHIASASRVFFVNPIWQPAIEAQAIKRAHRIGQSKPVYVETLVLTGTLEEAMWKRRKDMSAQEQKRAEKSLLDDNIMARLINEADFIPLSQEEMYDVPKQMAPLECPQQLFGRGLGFTGMRSGDQDLIFPEGLQLPVGKRRVGTDSVVDGCESSSSKKKTKKVGFALSPESD